MQSHAIGTDESPRNYKGVKLFCKDNESFPEGGVRHQIFQNGPALIEQGAVIKYGNKVIINERRWFELVQEGFFSPAKMGARK